MKIGLLCIMVFCLISCGSKEKQEIKELEKLEANSSAKLTDTLRINKDFTISYLKIDSLTYSGFKKQNKVFFKETKHGSLSCGNSSPMWSSSTTIKNDTLGIELNFNKSWVESTPEPKEQVLTNIKLDNAKAKFYNGIILGKSNIVEVKEKLGKPISESNYSLEYCLKKTRILFLYNELGVVNYITMFKAYQECKPQDSLVFK
ncbi:hypothetical protein AX016_3307 [Cellulophaga sp. RHA19]|uniref:hypothetical protein n=1 Tax=Cellulophaga sp. RHA19 TaxID=1798237 RepID=UPI000CAC8721|nr:hypothetical protein [Cellulophaga sp. RHA19]PKB45070.1 hypothetical protein AX016_3307 [Cellulophaga sp. RHA19]